MNKSYFPSPHAPSLPLSPSSLSLSADEVLVLNPEDDLTGKRAIFELKLLALSSIPERLKVRLIQLIKTLAVKTRYRTNVGTTRAVESVEGC